jgi:hypothetical protein
LCSRSISSTKNGSDLTGHQDLSPPYAAHFERIVIPGLASFFDIANFLADCDHGLAKPVDFDSRLRLGWLDHQCAGYRKAYRRRMKSAVDQALGNVVDRDTRGLLKRSNVDDAFVRNAVTLAPKR